MKSIKQVLKTTLKDKKIFGVQCAIFDQGETKTITAFTTKINDMYGILKEFKGHDLIKFEIHTMSHKPHMHILLKKNNMPSKSRK
jgi:hypothetical protein